MATMIMPDKEPVEPFKEPATIPMKVLSEDALAKRDRERFQAGALAMREAAANEAHEVAKSRQLACKRAAAAGRENVSSHRASDCETASAIELRIRSIDTATLPQSAPEVISEKGQHVPGPETFREQPKGE